MLCVSVCLHLPVLFTLRNVKETGSRSGQLVFLPCSNEAMKAVQTLVEHKRTA